MESLVDYSPKDIAKQTPDFHDSLYNALCKLYRNEQVCGESARTIMIACLQLGYSIDTMESVTAFQNAVAKFFEDNKEQYSFGYWNLLSSFNKAFPWLNT